MNRLELNLLIDKTESPTLRERTIKIAETYADSKTKDLSEYVKILENKIELLKEDLEAVHMWMDENNFPRANSNGAVYSIVGRIKNKKI